VSGPNINELCLSMTTELSKLSQWFKLNKLSLNIKKTNFIVFKPRTMLLHHVADVSSTIYNINSSGPSTEPWGMPYGTGQNGDCTSRRRADWDLSDKFDVNQSTAPSFILKVCDRRSRRTEWSTVSKAVVMSSRARTARCPSSSAYVPGRKTPSLVPSLLNDHFDMQIVEEVAVCRRRHGPGVERRQHAPGA